jgi:hypothetical protein
MTIALPRGVKLVILLSIASVIFLWQVGHPIIRFSSPILNDFVGHFIALVLPWFAALAVLRIRRRLPRLFTITAALFLLCYSLAVILSSAMAYFSYENGHDLGFEQFENIGWKGSSVRLYRTDGGATTDYGVVIRQERNVLPGIMLIRPIDTFYHCYSLSATSTETGILVTDQHSECRGFPDQHREYTLRSHLYF